jgi:UDP-2,4-diacetamido-2,4,6-trideoxy-beta-L-altropyranose hydrolase
MTAYTQTKIAIRTDANTAIGIGHVMRCIAVAEQLKALDCDIIFVCHELPASIKKKLLNRGFVVKTIDHHSHTSARIITESLNCMKDLGVKHCIIDGYHISDNYVCATNSADIRTIRFDDNFNGQYSNADLVINASPNSDVTHYKAWAPRARLLLGPKYCAFRQEIIDHWSRTENKTGNSQGIFLNFGGSDPLDLSVDTALRLSKTLPNIPVNVVTGAAYPSPEKFNSIGKDTINHFHDTHLITDLISNAKLAISAGGGTIAELALYRIPTILALTSENQEGAAEDTWCQVVKWENQREEFIHNLCKTTADLLQKPVIQAEMIQKISPDLDCFGAERIANEILNLK